MEYSVAHHGNQFFIMTNENAKNFKIMKTPVRNPAKRNWQEVLPHRKAVKIDWVELFKDHLVVYEREEGLEKIRIMDPSNQDFHYVTFDEPVYSISRSRNPEFNTNVLRFKYSSLTTPETVYDYTMTDRRREIKKQKEVLGGYESENYQSERIFATADDGTKVPISLVYKKDCLRKTLVR